MSFHHTFYANCLFKTLQGASKKLFTNLAMSILLAPLCLAQSLFTAKAQEPVAVVAGQTIYEDDLLPLVQSQLRQLRHQEYDLKKRVLENLIQQRILEAEAKKTGIPAEKLIEQEVNSGISEPTEAELEAFYLGQKDRLNRPFDDLKTQLRQALKQARLQQARQDYLKRLREKANVSILLHPPKVELSYDAARLRGNPKAPVTIVEFSDFQCSFCQKIQPTLKELITKYEGQVKLAFRDYPLRQMHPQAQTAAEASRCASEQGKFWEYHDLLFAAPSKLDRDSLAEHARSLELDMQQFDACLASGKFKARIAEDLQEGAKAGVTGTPTFFINGIFLSGSQSAAAFEQVIQSELSAPGQKPVAK